MVSNRAWPLVGACPKLLTSLSCPQALLQLNTPELQSIQLALNVQQLSLQLLLRDIVGVELGEPMNHGEHKQRTKAQPPPEAQLTHPDWGGFSLTRQSKATVQDCRLLWKTDRTWMWLGHGLNIA